MERLLKSNLKKKIRITQALLVMFLITGNILFANQLIDSEPIREGSAAINIAINNYPEEKGLELGTNGLSRGLGSITTGRDNIAIGKGAIATGNNETKETIETKINENEEKLNEISTQESKIREVVAELEKLKKKNQDVIDAANRVDALNKSKANLLNEYNRLKIVREELERNSAEKLREHEEKVADLNSKLSGVENLGLFNIANDTELTEKATQFKNQVEANNSLNLTIDFYKDYISSYYNALGELRLNEIEHAKRRSSDYNDSYNFGVSNPKGKYRTLNWINSIYVLNFRSDSEVDFGYSSFEIPSNSYYINAGITIEEREKPNMRLDKINIDTTVVDDDTYNKAVENVSKYKNLFAKHMEINNNPFFTEDMKEKAKEIINLKLDIFKVRYKIANLQDKYEKIIEILLF